jgi:hypothetical protein
MKISRQEIVKWARTLERARLKRRKITKQLAVCDGEIRKAQKFLRDLTDDTREID